MSRHGLRGVLERPGNPAGHDWRVALRLRLPFTRSGSRRVGVCEIVRKRHRLDVTGRLPALKSPPIGVSAIGGVKTASPRGQRGWTRWLPASCGATTERSYARVNNSSASSRAVGLGRGILQRLPCFPVMRRFGSAGGASPSAQAPGSGSLYGLRWRLAPCSGAVGGASRGPCGTTPAAPAPVGVLF